MRFPDILAPRLRGNDDKSRGLL